MRQFTYVIQDEVGIHARPAGMLGQKAKSFQSSISLECNGKSADAAKLMAVMALGATKGMEVTVTIEGEDETKAAQDLEQFFRENF